MLNWENILVVIGFILLVIILIKKGLTNKVNTMALYLVAKAEEEFGGGTGLLKYAAVTTWIYDRLPSILKLLFTDSQIDKIIEGQLKKFKEYLENSISIEE